MIGTSLLLIGPGVGRALIVYYNYSLNDAVNISDYLIIGIAAGMVIYDLVRKKSPKANMVVLFIILLMHTAWALRYTEQSQAVWGQFAKMFF